jgi:hypothetical protein
MTIEIIYAISVVLIGLPIGYSGSRMSYNDPKSDIYHQGGWAFALMLVAALVWPLIVVFFAIGALLVWIHEKGTERSWGRRMFGGS